jgi:hypothetical protein
MSDRQLTTWQRCPVGKPPCQVSKFKNGNGAHMGNHRCPMSSNKNKIVLQGHAGPDLSKARCHAYGGKNSTVPRRAKIMTAREKEHGKTLVTWT